MSARTRDVVFVALLFGVIAWVTWRMMEGG